LRCGIRYECSGWWCDPSASLRAHPSALQVLLSCSHAFHATCLHSFERYVGADRRTCPVCRAAMYQTRRVRLGARLHVLRCVTARPGHRTRRAARRRFFELRRSRYMGGAGAEGAAGGAVDEGRRVAFMASTLGDLHRGLHLADGAVSERASDLHVRLAGQDCRGQPRGLRCSCSTAGGHAGGRLPPLQHLGHARGSSSTFAEDMEAALALSRGPTGLVPGAQQSSSGSEALPSPTQDALLDELALRVYASEAAAAAAQARFTYGTIDVGHHSASTPPPQARLRLPPPPLWTTTPRPLRLDWSSICATAARGVGARRCAPLPCAAPPPGPRLCSSTRRCCRCCPRAAQAVRAAVLRPRLPPRLIESLERYVGVAHARRGAAPARRCAPPPPRPRPPRVRACSPSPAACGQTLAAAFSARMTGAERRQRSASPRAAAPCAGPATCRRRLGCRDVHARCSVTGGQVFKGELIQISARR